VVTGAWPGMLNRVIGIARVLVQPQNTRTSCRIINVKSIPQILHGDTRIAYLLPIDASDPFSTVALRGDQNSNASHLSAIGEHPDSTETVTSLEDKIEVIKAVGLQIDSAKKRLKEQEFKEIVLSIQIYNRISL
jgi:hypothetical protein